MHMPSLKYIMFAIFCKFTEKYYIRIRTICSLTKKKSSTFSVYLKWVQEALIYTEHQLVFNQYTVQKIKCGVSGGSKNKFQYKC